MLETFYAYWPHIFLVLSIVMGVPAAIHATMTKVEVRSAVGWVGVIILSPFIGALLYLIAGVNRIRRNVLGFQRSRVQYGAFAHLEAYDVASETVSTSFGHRFLAMKTLGDRVARHAFTTGNTIDFFDTGDKAYGEMLKAIASAERSILLETYIFDRDRIGTRFAEALIQAARRGVEVRVLIDAVGARYSVPSILGMLRDGGVRVEVFNGNVIIGLRLPYANLRTHRKIIIIDGTLAFTGGMNIREGFSAEISGDDCAFDTHFRVTGPVVTDLFAIASEDWQFESGEVLDGDPWQITEPQKQPGEPVLLRAVGSGPDRSNETNHKMLMGAFSIARKSIRIVSPYFLPDRELITALITAARRGVTVDIVVPDANNLTLVDRAMTAQFDQILKNYCRIWRATGPFNHSKLMAIDGCWAYVGSSNLDPRSLRLNFEVDLEVLDRDFAESLEKRIDTTIETASAVTLEGLRNRPFVVRLLEKVLWLGSPYL